MDRREFLGHSAAAAAGSCVLTLFGAVPAMAQAVSPSRTQPAHVLDQHYPFVLPPLGYAPDAVQPAVDTRTMSLHHGVHHAAYVANLNRALAPHAPLHGSTLRELLTGLATLPDGVRAVVRNDGGGHANHGLFWPLLAPRDATGPGDALRAAMERELGSLATGLSALRQAALDHFGSGWAWLCADSNARLHIHSTTNQNSPITERLHPIVGIDVWEHAYYLSYQNRRADYVDAIMARINWREADTRYASLPAGAPV